MIQINPFDTMGGGGSYTINRSMVNPTISGSPRGDPGKITPSPWETFLPPVDARHGDGDMALPPDPSDLRSLELLLRLRAGNMEDLPWIYRFTMKNEIWGPWRYHGDSGDFANSMWVCLFLGGLPLITADLMVKIMINHQIWGASFQTNQHLAAKTGSVDQQKEFSGNKKSQVAFGNQTWQWEIPSKWRF